MIALCCCKPRKATSYDDHRIEVAKAASRVIVREGLDHITPAAMSSFFQPSKRVHWRDVIETLNVSTSSLIRPYWLATALSVHLLRRYSTQRLQIREYTGGLPNHLLRQAIAYINEDLDQDLRLADIATVVHLSSHHFAGLFKQSVGLAPHQCVTQCRIERAALACFAPDRI